jgi:hypothetical protein
LAACHAQRGKAGQPTDLRPFVGGVGDGRARELDDERALSACQFSASGKTTRLELGQIRAKERACGTCAEAKCGGCHLLASRARVA